MKILGFIIGLFYLSCFYPNPLLSENEVPLPAYDELQEVKCRYHYKFSFNETRMRYNPIFIEIEKKEYILGGIGIVLYANFFVNTERGRSYFYYNNTDNIKLMNLSRLDSQTEYKKLSIPIYIFGFNKLEDISIHVYGMNNSYHHWVGNFKELEIIIKYKQQCVNILEKKWVKNVTTKKFSSSIALAILCKINQYLDITEIVNDYKINLHSSKYQFIKINTESLYRLHTRTDVPVSVVLCTPYVIETSGFQSYLKAGRNELYPVSRGGIHFCFQAYLYGIDKQNNNTKVYVEKASSMGGSLEDWKFYIQQNGKSKQPTDSKWIKDCKYGNKFFALAMTFDKENVNKDQNILQNGVIINHKDGIAFIKDIFLEENPTESIKNDFIFKPDPEISQVSNCLLKQTTKKAQYENKKILVDLLLINTNAFKQFCFTFNPGTTINLEGKEYSLKKTVRITVKDERGQAIPNIQLFSCQNPCFKYKSIGMSSHLGTILIKRDDSLKKIIFRGDNNYGFNKKNFDSITNNIDFVLPRKKKYIFFRVEDENMNFKRSLLIRVRNKYESMIYYGDKRKPYYRVELPIYPNETFSYSVYQNTKCLMKGQNKAIEEFNTSNPIVLTIESKKTNKRWESGTIDTSQEGTIKCKERALNFIITNTTNHKITNAKVVINNIYESFNLNDNCLVNFPACIGEEYSVSIKADGFIQKRDKITFSINDINAPLHYILKPVRSQIHYTINIEPFYKDQKIKDAIDYDDDLYIKVSCDGKKITLDYKQIDNHFSGEIDCQSKHLEVIIESKLFDLYKGSIKLDKKEITIKPEMKIKKPVFYLLINPSIDFNKVINRTDKTVFSDFKNNLLYYILRHFDSHPRSNKWSKVFFYKHIEDIEPKLLKQRDRFDVQWRNRIMKANILNNIAIQNASVPISILIDETLSFLNNISLSDSSGFKGIIVLILPTPSSPYYQETDFLTKLEKKLKSNKVVAYIALFGMVRKTKVYTEKDNSHLQLKEFDMEYEFFNRNFVKTAVKINNDIIGLLRLHDFYH